MAQRQYPIARVKAQEPGRTWQVRYDGFGQHDLLADLVRNGKVAVSSVDFADLGLPIPGPAGLQAPTAMLVDHRDLGCVVARPFLDTSQALGLGHFTTHGGAWVALPNHGLQGEVQLFQYQGEANQTIGVVSNFTLPTNPVFAVSLYRADPPPEFDWGQCAPCTELHFGVEAAAEWALVLPYGAPMYLMQHRAGQWHKVPETERTVRVPSLEGFSFGQRLLLWVAVWRGKLVISTDGFAQDMWVYTDPAGPIQIGSGKLALWHNTGQMMFSCFGIRMATATLDSAPVETGYLTEESTGEVLVRYRHLPVIDDQGRPLAQAQVADSTALRPDLNATQRAWRAQITPYVWEQDNVGVDPETGQPVGFRTCVSPELYSVTLGQYPQGEALTEPAVEDLSADVRRVEGDHSDRLRTVRYLLDLDNQLGQHLDLQEYQRVTVELGWRLDDASVEYTPALDGYVVEPPPEVLSGGRATLEVALLDDLLRLREEKADGRTPVFDGWSVQEVFRWALDRCGLPRGRQQLEDTGVVLSQGTPEEPLWLPEPGRSWLEFLEEVAQFDYGAGLWADAEGRVTKGCPHCRGLRTASDAARHDGTLTGACPSEAQWHLYTRHAAAPEPGEPGEILALSKPRLSASEREFVNYVAVCGVGERGEPIRSVVYDPASLYDPTSDRYVGWRKMEVAALRNYTTQAEVNRLALELFAARSQRPEYVSLLTPLEPHMQIGQVVAVHGAEQVGAGEQLYRIQALRHRLERKPGRVAVTWVKAKWLGSLTP